MLLFIKLNIVDSTIIRCTRLVLLDCYIQLYAEEERSGRKYIDELITIVLFFV